jgi:catechol 2,3-dioxygenase-like lactoylglutathione lyase family enzyme
MSPRQSLSLALLYLAGSPLFAQPPVASAPETGHITALYHVGFWIRDMAKARAFYENYLGFDEPYVLYRASGALQMVVIKVNEGQAILLFTDAFKILPNGDNLDHLGLVTDNAAALRDQLAAKGIKAGKVQKAHIGDLIFSITDPDGHRYEVTQFEPEGQLMKHQGMGLPATRISARLRSATLSTANLKAELEYYCDKMGFRETWRGTGSDGVLKQVELTVPDGTGSIVLDLYAATPGADAPRLVPEYCLEVPDVAKAFDILSRRAAAGGFPPPSPITTGLNGKRQTSCVDPDGTRVVFMEP